MPIRMATTPSRSHEYIYIHIVFYFKVFLMARGSLLTSFEIDIIRIGVAHKIPVQKIAKFLNRGRAVVYNHIKKMESENTLQALPFAFVCEEIARAMRLLK